MVIITVDFKENVSINHGPVESARQFYNQSQRAILGAALFYLTDQGQTNRNFWTFI